MTEPTGGWDEAHTLRERVGQAVSAFVADRGRALRPLGADIDRLLHAAEIAVAGGKRFRAAFCWWGYQAVAGEPADPSALVRACGSLELLHASALVHDDYMDASDTRRGRLATHRAFSRMMRERGWPGDPDRYGASAAILLGDLLLSWADEMLRTCGLREDRVAAALRYFDLTRAEVVAGQFLDVSAQARGASDVEEAMTVLRYKSAKYSIERPLHVGAALAGGSPDTIAALSRFGLPLGEAFQLRDDLLGVFGDPETTGKPAGDDLTEGKRTVLVALALDALPPADMVHLDRALGTPLDEPSVAHLRDLVERSGARHEVETMIDRLTDQALAALEDAPIEPATRGALRELADAATQRVV